MMKGANVWIEALVPISASDKEETQGPSYTFVPFFVRRSLQTNKNTEYREIQQTWFQVYERRKIVSWQINVRTGQRLFSFGHEEQGIGFVWLGSVSNIKDDAGRRMDNRKLVQYSVWHLHTQQFGPLYSFNVFEVAQQHVFDLAQGNVSKIRI